MSDDQTVLSPQDRDSVLAAEYVLGVLAAAEHADIAKRIHDEPVMAALVTYWQTRFMVFDSEFTATNPPATLKASIDKRLFVEMPAPKVQWWNSLVAWRSAAFASAAVAVVAGGMALYVPPPALDSAPTAIATLSAETPANTFSIIYNAAESSITISRAAGDALTTNDFEVWAIVGQQPPVSLGLVPRTGSGVIHINAADAALLKPAVVLAISLEPAGGSTTGAPMGPVLSAGSLKEI